MFSYVSWAATVADAVVAVRFQATHTEKYALYYILLIYNIKFHFDFLQALFSTATLQLQLKRW